MEITSEDNKWIIDRSAIGLCVVGVIQGRVVNYIKHDKHGWREITLDGLEKPGKYAAMMIAKLEDQRRRADPDFDPYEHGYPDDWEIYGDDRMGDEDV